jgi:GTP-binding protein LepA
MDIERERGITIKAQTVRLHYKAKDGETYVLNLIDTPGHVDFAYEVPLARACEGSLLVVDASQGVEAQTLANVYAGDRCRPRDRAGAQQDRPAGGRAGPVKEQIEDVIGLDASDAVMISAKTGIGITGRAGGHRHAAAATQGRRHAKDPLKAMLVDSWYDTYLGVIVLVRVIDGEMKKGQQIR